jgi:hypothetical protein
MPKRESEEGGDVIPGNIKLEISEPAGKGYSLGQLYLRAIGIIWKWQQAEHAWCCPVLDR